MATNKPRQIQIQFTPEQLKTLKEAVKEAEELDFKTFEWEGEKFFTKYGRELIKHFERGSND